MLPIMMDHNEKQRKEMIQAALEEKAPEMYQSLKKSMQLPKFLTIREQMLMEAFKTEKNRIITESVSSPTAGENPIQQTQEIERNLLSAWEQTTETFLDFGD